MRILYLIDTLEMGGAETSLTLMLPRLKQMEPLVCHVYAGDSLRPAFESAGIRVVSTGLTQKYALGQAIRRVLRLAQAQNIALIHSALFRSDIVARVAGGIVGIPVINTLVNESYAATRFARLSRSMRWKMGVVQTIDRATAPLALHFVANSEAIKAANAADLGIPASKITVIYRGRDPAQFLTPSAEEMQALRRSLSIPDATPVLLNVGRLVLAKNQAGVIRAMSHIVRQAPECRLLIAGEGPLRPSLEALLAELGLAGHVRLLGNRNDVPQLLQLADVFVFPSLYEGHPGALVEAMFAGLPIVASDIAVHRETLLDGEAGVLTSLGDAAALAARALELLRQPARAATMGQRGREIALERFDINRIAAQHEALYSDLLQRWRMAH